MSETARNLAPTLDRPRVDALAELLPPVTAAEHNDNETATELVAGERRIFEIPGRYWKAMIAFYGAFFAAMFADFQAVSELGWIAGCGVLLCAFACFTTLPALLMLFDRRDLSGRSGEPSRTRGAARLAAPTRAV